MKRKLRCQTMDFLITPRTFKQHHNNLLSFIHCNLREDQTCFNNPIKCRPTWIPLFLNYSETRVFKKFLAGITENEARVCILCRFILYETTITPKQTYRWKFFVVLNTPFNILVISICFRFFFTQNGTSCAFNTFVTAAMVQ